VRRKGSEEGVRARGRGSEEEKECGRKRVRRE
jgi:hypothetical protein